MFPARGFKSHAKYFTSSYFGEPIVLTIGLGDTILMNFGSAIDAMHYQILRGESLFKFFIERGVFNGFQDVFYNLVHGIFSNFCITHA